MGAASRELIAAHALDATSTAFEDTYARAIGHEPALTGRIAA
jgi:hypothetical protein